MRRFSLLPAALAILVFGGCGKNEGGGTQTAGGASTAAGKIDYWPMLGPLLAGSYTGGCMRLPQSEVLRGVAIVLDEHGRLSAPDIGVDMRGAQMIQLARESKAGTVKVSAMLSIDAANGPVLSLSDEGRPDGASAVIMQSESQISCGKGAPLAKLRGQPLYKVAARVIEGSGRTLKCGNLKTRMEWKDTGFRVANGIVTLGAESFDLRLAGKESLMLTAEENQLAYSFSLPGRPLMYVFYDAAGQVMSVEGRTEHETTHACHIDA